MGIFFSNSFSAKAIVTSTVLALIGAALAHGQDGIAELLRSKDMQIDNIHITYTSTGRLEIPAQAPQHESQIDVTGIAPPSGEFLPIRYFETLTIRGSDVTFDRTLDKVYSKPIKDTEAAYYQKWSNKENLQRELVDPNPETNWGLLSIDTDTTQVDLAMEQRMEVEFALGFGFGKRILEVTSDEQNKEGTRTLRGLIRLWSSDTSNFVLVVDKDLLVRSATIQCRDNGRLATDFEVHTEGVVSVDGFRFAKTGSFKRTALGVMVANAIKANGSPKTVKEFSISFTGATFNLSDDAYNAYTDMSPPPGTHVRDVVNDRRYSVDEGGKIVEKGKVNPFPPRVKFSSEPLVGGWSGQKWLLLIINVGVVLFLLALILRRRAAATR